MSGKNRKRLLGVAPRLEQLAALCFAFGVVSCSDTLPECPPGTAFDDCKVSPVASLMPAGQGAAGSTAGGSGSGAGPIPAGGASTEAPVTNTTPVVMPAPAVMTPPAPAPTPTASLMDACPDDPLKTVAGMCGCGVAEDDFDGDGALDCRETCPDNPSRTAPMGACGCSTLADTAGCQGLRDALRNLYTFNGTGTTITDSLAGRNGVIADAVGALAPAALGRLQQNGRVALDGFGSFVQLPAGLISDLTSATFEVWLVWQGAGFWERVFDFGNNDGGNPANGLSYLFLTPSNSNTSSLRVAYSLNGPGQAETVADGTLPLPTNTPQDRIIQHIAVVVDDTAAAMQLYLNGNQVGTVALTGSLAQLQDVNNWLGRSNYSVDPPLFGSLIEFRIYDQALTAAQIGVSFRAGPGALG